MEVCTANFGTISATDRDIIRFPEGLAGLEDCHNWLILADSLDAELLWLQSADRAEIALPVVSPTRFVPQYRVRVDADELTSLAIDRDRDVQVLVTVNHIDSLPTINLKAPLVINLSGRVGRQVVVPEAWSIRHLIAGTPGSLRRTA